MKIFFDTEFYEDGKLIELISIGMVREDGATYYAESTRAQTLVLNSPWLIQNVKPHPRGEQFARYRDTMAGEIEAFAGDAPEFWADYASYDWIVLCQIFGTMLKLPKGWPMFVRDVQQLRQMRAPDVDKIPTPPNRAQHDALADAYECKAKHDWLWEHGQ